MYIPLWLCALALVVWWRIARARHIKTAAALAVAAYQAELDTALDVYKATLAAELQAYTAELDTAVRAYEAELDASWKAYDAESTAYIADLQQRTRELRASTAHARALRQG
jgi:hypothetical protein